MHAQVESQQVRRHPSSGMSTALKLSKVPRVIDTIRSIYLHAQAFDTYNTTQHRLQTLAESHKVKEHGLSQVVIKRSKVPIFFIIGSLYQREGRRQDHTFTNLYYFLTSYILRAAVGVVVDHDLNYPSQFLNYTI